LGLLALVQVLREHYDEAEALAREAQALDSAERRRRYYLSVQGAALLGKGKYDAAEPFLLKGYEGMKKWEAYHPAVRRRLTYAGGWIVRLYEATNQPDKARVWRETLKAREANAASSDAK
jgi:hypothetical protein